MVKENPDFEYYKTSILSEEEFEERIDNEMKKSLLSTFFIIHDYIEALLLDWLSYCGDNKPLALSKKVQEDIERIGFANLAQLHVFIGNISQDLFARLNKFNYARNSLAHGIREIDFVSKKTNDGLESNIKQGVNLYKELFQLYKKKLDAVGQRFILGQSKLGEKKLQ